MIYTSILKSAETRRIATRLLPLLTGLGLAAAGFAAIADEVREGDTLVVDEYILRTINQTAAPWLDTFFKFLTDLGGLLFVGVLSAMLCIALYQKRYVYRSLFVAVAMGGAGLLIIFLKLVFGRTRPDLWQQVVSEASFSFPSGHATASSALAICLVMVSWQTKWRYPVLAIGILYVLVIGYSRLYLGVHYPTDILGGWALSAAWLGLVGLVLNTHFLHTKGRDTSAKTPFVHE